MPPQMPWLPIIVVLAGAQAGKAEPGDTLFVQVDEATVHTEPGQQHPVKVRLDQGHELVEL